MANKVLYNQSIESLKDQMIISVEYLMARTFLDFNIDPIKIIPYIVEAQELKLEPIIGTALYQKLQEKNLDYEYQYLLDKYVGKALIHMALTSFLEVLPYSAANGGLFKHQSTDAEVVTQSEAGAIVQRERYKAMDYTNRMNKFLSTYQSHYPEYTECQSEGEGVSRLIGLSGGLVLDYSNPSPKRMTNTDTTGYCHCGIDWPVPCGTGGCGTCGYNPNLFIAEFYHGYSATSTIPALNTLTKVNTIPNSVVAQPTSNYFWMVSDWNFEILQGMNLIPIGAWSDVDQLAQVYVKTLQGDLYYIRVKMSETYETSVRFNIKIIT